MRAAALTGVGKIEVIETAEPRIERGTDVLLKVETVGICGSDVHYFETGRIGSGAVEYPFVIGHECAATAAGVGDRVRRVKVGDRVAVEPGVVCHQCDQCRAGRFNTCRNMKFLGCPGQMAGALCEYVVMPEECCFAVDDRMSFDEAVLCEPLAIAIYAVRQGKLKKGFDIAILGAGPIGLSCIVSAKAEGVREIYVTERIKERMEIAGEAGARWVGNPDNEDVVRRILDQQPPGIDAAFECAGEQETLDQCVDLLKPGGRLMLIGIPRTDRISFIVERMRHKEITLVNVRRQNECTQAAVDAVTSGRIDVKFMATHHFKLEQVQEAFEMVADYRDGVVKAMVEL
jgi:L-iditol 2-dehydrogenase